MTATQAQTAKSEGDRFLLCVVPISSGVSEPEPNIEDTMMFVADMNSRVAPLCDDLANLQKLREYVTADESNGVRLEVEAGAARIRVTGSVWRHCGFLSRNFQIGWNRTTLDSICNDFGVISQITFQRLCTEFKRYRYKSPL